MRQAFNYPWIAWNLNQTMTIYYFLQKDSNTMHSNPKEWFLNCFQKLLDTQIKQFDTDFVNIKQVKSIFKNNTGYDYYLQLRRLEVDIDTGKKINNQNLVGGLLKCQYTPIEAKTIKEFKQLIMKYNITLQ